MLDGEQLGGAGPLAESSSTVPAWRMYGVSLAEVIRAYTGAARALVEGKRSLSDEADETPAWKQSKQRNSREGSALQIGRVLPSSCDNPWKPITDAASM